MRARQAQGTKAQPASVRIANHLVLTSLGASVLGNVHHIQAVPPLSQQ